MARSAGRAQDVLTALDDAWNEADTLDSEHPLRVRVAWKRAKAIADFGVKEDLAPCIAPVLGHPLFLDTSSLRGASRLARMHQDAIGFGNPTILALWSKLAAHHKAVGDRYQWAMALLQIAWDAGCRGQTQLLDTTLQSVDALRPADLEDSRSRHPLAADGAESVVWLHVEGAHTRLRAASWQGDLPRVQDAVDTCLWSLEELPDAAPRVCCALEEARFHFGTSAPDTVLDDDSFQARFHASLRAKSGFLELEGEAREQGPEWALAIRLAALRSGTIDERSVRELARESGCDAFLHHLRE